MKEKKRKWWNKYTFWDIGTVRVYVVDLKTRKGIIKEFTNKKCIFEFIKAKNSYKYKYCNGYDGEVIYVK